MVEAFDAIVTGAGVMGCSTAFHLAQLGLRRTVVLERGGLCSGNTRKSGALVRMHDTNEPGARLALASLRTFRHWSDLVGGECGFRQSGFLVLVSADNEARLRGNVEMLRRVGVNTRVADTAELRDFRPGLDLSDGAVGAIEPDSGYADPVLTTTSFMRHARERGAELREGVSVTAIMRRGEPIEGPDEYDLPTDWGHRF